MVNSPLIRHYFLGGGGTGGVPLGSQDFCRSPCRLKELWIFCGGCELPAGTGRISEYATESTRQTNMMGGMHRS